MANLSPSFRGRRAEPGIQNALTGVGQVAN